MNKIKAKKMNAPLKNHNIKSSISKIINKKPYFIIENEYKINNLKKIFVEKNYDLIPVTDENKRVIDVIFFHDLVKKTYNNFESKYYKFF